MHDRLMNAYWVESLNIGDRKVLRNLAVGAGLDAGEVDEVLAGDGYRERVETSTGQAAAIGATGVPAWVLDGRLLVLGAQPREVFDAGFAQLGVVPIDGDD